MDPRFPPSTVHGVSLLILSGPPSSTSLFAYGHVNTTLAVRQRVPNDFMSFWFRMVFDLLRELNEVGLGGL